MTRLTMTEIPSSNNPVGNLRYTLTGNSAWHWFQKASIVVLFSLFVNHLSRRESFPGSGSYRFPIEGFISTIVLCILALIIAELNFNYYQKKYFSKKVNINIILRFLVSTLGYFAIMYIPINIIIDLIAGGDTIFYFLLIGLLLSLLICSLLIVLLYGRDIYNLYQLSMKGSAITVEKGAKIVKLNYEDIACFYIDHKIVYAVHNDGMKIITDFTLNQLEEKINDQLFFRVNRQTIIHKEAVDQIEKIENGKLLVRLKSTIDQEAISEINISRYKRKEFIDWFRE